MIVHARLVCSDSECTSTYEAWGPLAEVEAFACECGCTLEVVAWPDPVDGGEGPAELEAVGELTLVAVG